MTLLSAMLRADARRPASWFTLLAAFVAACEWSGRHGFPGAVAAWLCGGALAVAAIGAPLPAHVVPLLHADAWMGLRVAWPAMGALLGAVVGGASVGDPPAQTAVRLLVFLLGGCAAFVVRVAADREGESEADGASLALVLLGTAALAGQALACGDGMTGLAGAVIVVAWGLQAVALAWLGKARAKEAWGGATSAASGVLPLPAFSSPLRRGLVGTAMVLSLAGMASWLFLEPRGAGSHLWASLVGLVALAGPAVTIGDDRLDPRLGRLLTAGLPPGLRRAGRSAVTPDGSGRSPLAAGIPSPLWLHAAVIAWPSVVAAALLLGEGPRSLGAMGIAAAVGVATSFLAIVASRRLPLGSPETRLAVSLSLAVILAVVASR